MMWLIHSTDSLDEPENNLNIDGIPMQELLDISAYGWVQDETLE